MTDVGRVVFRYADEIFGIGGELMDQCAGAPRPLQLTVGVATAVPKFVAYRPLHPAARGEDPVYMGCREDNAEQSITLLSTHALDVVIRIRRRRRTCASRS